jgi:hypothetical protein
MNIVLENKVYLCLNLVIIRTNVNNVKTLSIVIPPKGVCMEIKNNKYVKIKYLNKFIPMSL